MAGSGHQDDEQQPQAGPADALRDAVERTFRDAGAALQRLTAQQGGGDQQRVLDAIESLSSRVDALAKRVDALEATPAKPAKKKAAARKTAAKKSAK
jgi:hypothetical protein